MSVFTSLKSYQAIFLDQNILVTLSGPTDSNKAYIQYIHFYTILFRCAVKIKNSGVKEACERREKNREVKMR